MNLFRALLLMLLLPCAVWAADVWPSKPIRMVIAFPAGGPTDVNARMFAKSLGDQLGQQVIVDNKPGAGANIASAFVANAPADGYTVYYNTSSLVLGALLYRSAKHDPLKDFAPIARTAGVPIVLVSNPDVPAKTLADLVAYAKKNPDKLNYASSGAGTIDHLAGELFNRSMGIKMRHVPYKGTAPALTDLIGGATQVMLTTLNTAKPFIDSGKLVALAIASQNRSPLLPSVPTIVEAVNTTLEVTAWQGIVAPAGTPRAIVARLNSAINNALQQKAFRDTLTAGGSEIYGGSPEEYGTYLKAETAQWKKLLQETGVQAE